MTRCEDCSIKDATSIVFDTTKQDFYRVCDDCISKTDIVCPFKGLEEE